MLSFLQYIYVCAKLRKQSKKKKKMMQKIVIKVSMQSHKCHSKALKIAVGIPGVESVRLAGKEKDEVVVIGDGIDSVELTRRLRKVAHAELVSVGKAKKESSNSDSDSDSDGHSSPGAYLPPPCYNYCIVKEPAGIPFCTIM